jgi:hypothetical protein
MLAQFGAKSAAVHSVAAGFFQRKFSVLTGMAVVAVTLVGCMPPGVPLVGADPADPSARVSGAVYRSQLGSYTSMRPVSPGPWIEQNQRSAPKPKQ